MRPETLWSNYNRFIVGTEFDPNTESFVSFMDQNKQALQIHQNSLSKVAVTVPAYKEQRSIARLIASVNNLLNENPQSINLLIIDNNSQDATAEIAEYMGATVVPEPIKGIGRARKTGLEATNPENTYIFTTDSDCVIPLDWFQTHQETLEDPEVCFSIGTSHLLIDQSISWNKKLGFLAYMKLRSQFHKIRNKLITMPLSPTGQNSAYRRQQALDAGGYRELPASEDRFIMLDLIDSTDKPAKNTNSSVLASARRTLATPLLDRFLRVAEYNIRLFIHEVPKDKSNEPVPSEYPDYRPEN